MRNKIKTLVSIFLISFSSLSAQENDALLHDSGWSFHFQLTVISQAHSGFNAKYSGTNSLADSVELGATSITSTLFIGRKLWKGAAFYVNPELSGGRGLSYAVGVAGALNGETYRIGDPAPVVSIARAYLQQNIAIGNDDDNIDDAVNQVSGKIPSKRITISAGKFSMSDFYDKNSYSHDPRTQFLNWSLMSNGAWDYPANTKGYTFGIVAELIQPNWAIRLSGVAVPKIANHPEMEYRFGKAHSETAEFEHKISINKKPGTVRLLFSYTASRAPSYQQGMIALANNDTTLLKVISGNAEGNVFGGKKTGICLNAEQELTNDIGIFLRGGWNDGKHVTWAFTEIDQTAQIGFSLKGSRWKRKEDVAGVAYVINGISADHRAFLKAGGYGFIIGDGNLNYAHEQVAELYYNCKLFNNFLLGLDYQFVNHPAYNKDRGPAHVFGVRGHVEF
ncbi:MAG: carbohydrate porin [Bacteroidetes bacterium]|nr:carbohydrate porin [Bacteroidota bacterium]